MNRFKSWGKWAVASLVALISLVFLWPDRKTSPDTAIATPAKEVKDLTKVAVPVKNPVKAYSGGSTLKKKLDLPADVVQDDTQHVIASSKVECDQPHTITTTINTETGEIHTYERHDPLPWIASDDHSRIGIYALLKNGTPTVSLQAQRGLFSIKSVHFVGRAGIDQPMSGGQMNTQIGFGAEWWL